MLDKAFYNFILKTANDEAEDNVKFRGNYAIVQMGDIPLFQEVDTLSMYATNDVGFVPMAETISNDIAFTEENNRSDWTKTFMFKIRGREKDRVLQSLQNIRDYFFNDSIHNVSDEGTIYKFLIKCSRPQFAGSYAAQAGDVELLYAIQINATSILSTKGYFTDEIVYHLKIDGDLNFTAIPTTNVTTNQETTHDISNDITAEANSSSEPIARGMLFTLDILYTGTDVDKKIYKILNGKDSRETKFVLRETFDVTAYEYDVTIQKGSKIRKKGTVLIMTVHFVES